MGTVIEEYIRKQDASKQERLFRIYEIMKQVMPEAEEKISYAMPTFHRGRNIIHFAAMKNHTGIYPGPEVIERFADRLKGYKTSKGAICIKDTMALDETLVKDIAEAAYALNRK